MGQVHTSGLIVHPSIVIHKERRLPLEGQVLVKVGDHVDAQDVVAKSEIPGLLQSVPLSEKLGIEPKNALHALKIPVGSFVQKGEILAESKSLFGWFQTSVISDYSGLLKSVSDMTGHVFIEEPALPVTILAFIEGEVVQVIENEGVVVESLVSFVQGIFGVGGEGYGTIRVAVSSAADILKAEHILESDRSFILVGGSGVTEEALQRAGEVGVSGIIVGSIEDQILVGFVGHEIGVALTGQENITFSLVLTEGFGGLSMASRTFDLLSSSQGRPASISGATQVRAGVVRPEVLIPQKERLHDSFSFNISELKVGGMVRIVCEPYFGKIGKILDLPSELIVMESGIEARSLKVSLVNGEEVFVPKANVEILSPFA